MKNYSPNNQCKCSDGSKISRLNLEAKMRVAKEVKLAAQRYQEGYNFCERCERNDCKPIDVSHNVSVKKAIESGRSELCWDTENMEILGRHCHKIKDGLNLQFNIN
jgi:hypothetical protein